MYDIYNKKLSSFKILKQENEEKNFDVNEQYIVKTRKLTFSSYIKSNSEHTIDIFLAKLKIVYLFLGSKWS